MDVRDPVPTVSIPVTVGKRTIMVPLSTPEECAALIALVCAARKMIDAAAEALAEWNSDVLVDATIVDEDEPEPCASVAPFTGRKCTETGAHEKHRSGMVVWEDDDAWRLTPAGLAALDDEAADRELCTFHGGSDDQLSKGCELCAEELAILDAQPADEPKAGASLLAELRDRVGVGEPVGRPGDEFGPAAPVTHLACGDQLRDAGAALLAVGAVAWCTVHGNTEVISAEEHAATAPACGARPYPAGSEGDDGTECALPAGHAGPHDGAIADDEASGGVLFGPFETRTLALVPPAAGQ